mmetsp:Transcript_5786/g.13333  ORF Transcript_5786/g.13333 Transcript_5786/m.13333 type:complete len:217 (-) Transcript_5786:432-1082(-)
MHVHCCTTELLCFGQLLCTDLLKHHLRLPVHARLASHLDIRQLSGAIVLLIFILRHFKHLFQLFQLLNLHLFPFFILILLIIDIILIILVILVNLVNLVVLLQFFPRDQHLLSSDVVSVLVSLRRLESQFKHSVRQHLPVSLGSCTNLPVLLLLCIHSQRQAPNQRPEVLCGSSCLEAPCNGFPLALLFLEGLHQIHKEHQVQMPVELFRPWALKL